MEYINKIYEINPKLVEKMLRDVLPLYKEDTLELIEIHEDGLQFEINGYKNIYVTDLGILPTPINPNANMAYYEFMTKHFRREYVTKLVSEREYQRDILIEKYDNETRAIREKLGYPESFAELLGLSVKTLNEVMEDKDDMLKM